MAEEARQLSLRMSLPEDHQEEGRNCHHRMVVHQVEARNRSLRVEHHSHRVEHCLGVHNHHHHHSHIQTDTDLSRSLRAKQTKPYYG